MPTVNIDVTDHMYNEMEMAFTHRINHLVECVRIYENADFWQKKLDRLNFQHQYNRAVH